MRIALLFVLLSPLVGCGPDLSHLPKTVKAEGIVLLDGKPVEEATVVCIPEDGSENGASAKSDADGKFSLRSFDEKEGAVPGKFRVTVRKTVLEQTDKNADIGTVNVSYGVPQKYSGGGTSPLRLTIPEEDITDIKFELSSK